jgi:hypothetical protein
MPFASDWNTVAQVLAARGAQPYARPLPNVQVYYAPATGQFIKVTRTSSGYEYSTHRSRADCGC